MSKCTATRGPRVAVAYLRASKNEQRLSREAQRASIEAWAIREGVRVAVWCTDHGVRSVSRVAARPALRAALAALRQHAAGVFVVARRDRIARDVVLAASVEAAVSLEAARVVSASGEGNGDSPADAFIRTVIDGAAQYEHGLIRSRTCAGLAAKRARGERIGSVPLGFALDADGVRLVVDDASRRRSRALASFAPRAFRCALLPRVSPPKGKPAAPGAVSWRSKSHAWSIAASLGKVSGLARRHQRSRTTVAEGRHAAVRAGRSERNAYRDLRGVRSFLQRAQNRRGCAQGGARWA